MVHYRRSRTPGASYFFTVNLKDRSQRYLLSHSDPLRLAFREVRLLRPFEIPAFVILPDHLHMIMRLPTDDNDFPGRWKAIKSRFTKALVKEGVALLKNVRGEYDLWQRRYWEHQIRDESDLQRHVDYIHYNPVKHGHVAQAGAWPHSSFHHYVTTGVLPANWSAGHFSEDEDGFGE